MKLELALANLGAELAMVRTGQHDTHDEAPLDERTFDYVLGRLARLLDVVPPVLADRIECTASVLSVDFTDYTPAARAKYEGTHMFVGVHLPVEWAGRIPLGQPLVLEVPR